jgi:hypothetical protein
MVTPVMLGICLIIGIIIGIINDKTPSENAFGINKSDTFTMSHCNSVNGVTGYKKKEFSHEEIDKVLKVPWQLKI